MGSLWSDEVEVNFFRQCLSNFSTPNKIFYTVEGEYYSYIPKASRNTGQVLQSRNSLIGSFTEKWCYDLIAPIAKKFGWYAVSDMECEELGLGKHSGADLAICAEPAKVQKPENIKLIFEIKMSIVSNYRLVSDSNIEFVGDYTTHRGQPSLLRSDSMLKAIGKAINIRVLSTNTAKIPIVILGNSPIHTSYAPKVDALRSSGVIQQFISLNRNIPQEAISETNGLGFTTASTFEILEALIGNVLTTEMHYFSAMIPLQTIGRIIFESAKETTDIKRAEKFLQLLGEV